MIQESATWFVSAWVIWSVIAYTVGRFHGKDQAENEHRVREMEARLDRMEAHHDDR